MGLCTTAPYRETEVFEVASVRVVPHRRVKSLGGSGVGLVLEDWLVVTLSVTFGRRSSCRVVSW